MHWFLSLQQSFSWSCRSRYSRTLDQQRSVARLEPVFRLRSISLVVEIQRTDEKCVIEIQDNIWSWWMFVLVGTLLLKSSPWLRFFAALYLTGTWIKTSVQGLKHFLKRCSGSVFIFDRGDSRAFFFFAYSAFILEYNACSTTKLSVLQLRKLWLWYVVKDGKDWVRNHGCKGVILSGWWGDNKSWVVSNNRAGSRFSLSVLKTIICL